MLKLCKAKIRVLPKYPGTSQKQPAGSFLAPCCKPLGHEGSHNSMMQVEGGTLVGPAPKFCAIDWKETGASPVPGEKIKGKKILGHE